MKAKTDFVDEETVCQFFAANQRRFSNMVFPAWHKGTGACLLISVPMLEQRIPSEARRHSANGGLSCDLKLEKRRARRHFL